MERPEGFEPPTSCFVDRHSIRAELRAHSLLEWEMVWIARIERATPCFSDRCSTRLSYIHMEERARFELADARDTFALATRRIQPSSATAPKNDSLRAHLQCAERHPVERACGNRPYRSRRTCYHAPADFSHGILRNV